MICVSRRADREAPRLQRRMGWNFNWASSYESDFKLRLGVSSTEAETREGGVTPDARTGGLPADSQPETPAPCGTDVGSYISEVIRFNTSPASATPSSTLLSSSRGGSSFDGLLPDLGPHPDGRGRGRCVSDVAAPTTTSMARVTRAQDAPGCTAPDVGRDRTRRTRNLAEITCVKAGARNA